jgi:hypothetical protein
MGLWEKKEKVNEVGEKESRPSPEFCPLCPSVPPSFCSSWAEPTSVTVIRRSLVDTIIGNIGPFFSPGWCC